MIDRYKHISFDLDGTLVHTKPEYQHQVVQRVLKAMGRAPASPDVIKRLWFHPNRSATIEKEFGMDADTFWRAFDLEDVPEMRAQLTDPYAEVISALRRLKQRGKFVSVISGSSRPTVEMEVAKLGDVPWDHVCAIGFEFKEKPHPEALHHVLGTLNVPAKDTLYVGNGFEDGLFAQAAGCDFVLIDRDEYEHPGEHSYRVIRSLDELFG